MRTAKRKKVVLRHTKITIQIKFQNHIYGHNLADDKIKTDHRQIMSENTQT